MQKPVRNNRRHPKFGKTRFPKRNGEQSRVNSEPQSKIRTELPEQLESKVILLDQEDFFGIYLDLVMFNLTLEPVFKVSNHAEYKQMREKIALGKYIGNTYIIDETFGWGIVDLKRLVDFIRQHDPKAFVIGATAMAKEDILQSEIYDKVVSKSRNVREDNITLALAEHLKVDFIESNGDPKYKGKQYMDQLAQTKDGFPPKIYRDPNGK
jgi:hypothetical protein